MPEAPIQDEDELLRWILERWIVSDKATGSVRLSSEAFEESSDEEDGTPGGVSLFVAKETSPEKVLSDAQQRCKLPVCALAGIPAGTPRKEEYVIVRDPLEWDASHVNVVPPKVSLKELKRRRRRLADSLEFRFGDDWRKPPLPAAPTSEG